MRHKTSGSMRDCARVARLCIIATWRPRTRKGPAPSEPTSRGWVLDWRAISKKEWRECSFMLKYIANVYKHLYLNACIFNCMHTMLIYGYCSKHGCGRLAVEACRWCTIWYNNPYRYHGLPIVFGAVPARSEQDPMLHPPKTHGG